NSLLRSFCKPAIALERAREMVAHGAARLDRIAGSDAIDDAAVLLLDALEIGAPVGRRVDRQSHALARDDVAAEEGEEARELRVAGRLGDGAMEGEVLRHRALPRLQRAIDGAQRRRHRGHVLAAAAFGGET